ncbi:MAG: tetratricopeptide repeat protein, partial [Elusimicrobia bacterium]|nr:tetratricopeptide repeat protein [Elusimicrobiota bacterium]
AAAAGRRDAALASLAAAERASADPVFLRRLAAAYRDAGDSRAAGRVRRRAGDDAGLLLDRAEAAAAAGDRRGAAALLSRAASLGLDDDEARRVVLLRQSQGDYAGAAEVARARIVLRPVDARWRNDLGVLHSLMGRDDEAAADWAAAIALDPDGLAPYLSLGTLYSSAGRRRDALELYEKSLSRRHVPSEAGVLRRILEERRKLLP